MTTKDNPLALELRKENLNETDAMELQSSFLPFFQEAQDLKGECEKIIVTSADQKDMITKAREMRLAMKRIRTSTENVRKELKAESLRRGKAIDGMANIIKFLVEPIEEHLEKQENFALLQEQQRMQEIKDKRVEDLRNTISSIDALMKAKATITGGGTITEDLFEKLLQGAETSFKLKKEAEEKLAKEKKEKDEADAKERERIRLENIALKEKADKERIAREKLEKEKKEREEAEEKERKRLAKEAKKLAAAPDKEKLEALALAIEALPLPNMKTDEAQDVMGKTMGLLAKVTKFIRDEAAAL